MSYISRTAIHKETWRSIQTEHNPYDGLTWSYPCGCRCNPTRPHESFHLCDYHQGFNDGCWAMTDQAVLSKAQADR